MPSAAIQSHRYEASFDIDVDDKATPLRYSAAVSVTDTGTGKEKTYELYDGNFKEGTQNYQAHFLGDILSYLLAILSEQAAVSEGEDPPLLFEEVYTEHLVWGINPEESIQHWPTSLSLFSNGDLLLGLNSVCVATDRYFRVQEEHGEQFRSNGYLGYAFNAGVTPGDTVIFNPAGEQVLYLSSYGKEKFHKLHTSAGLYSDFCVLADGSAVLVNSTSKKAEIVGLNGKTSIELFQNGNSSYADIKTDADGNIWTYDGMENRIKIFAPNGKLLKSFIPLRKNFDSLYVLGLEVCSNGRFLLASEDELTCFNARGQIVWSIHSKGNHQGMEISGQLEIAHDSAKGITYLTNYQTKKVYVLLDREKIGEMEDAPTIRKIVALNKRREKSPENLDILKEKALLYESIDAYELAKGNWEGILSVKPYNEEAAEHIKNLDIKVMKRTAARFVEEVEEKLDRFGPETARPIYQKAVSMYEKILSTAPWDREAEDEKRKLQRIFRDRTAASYEKKEFFNVTDSEIANIFPSRIHYYQNNPIGTVTIKNIGEEPILRLKSSLYIKKYMDFPTESISETHIKPGAEKEILLKAVFNESVLSLQEDLPIQAQIKISAGTAKEKQTIQFHSPLTLYRRTALTWDKTANLAPFITPNEGIVSSFSHNALGMELPDTAETGVPKNIVKAVKICDALGIYRISYIEDPDSPITEVLGKEQIVDTVRFPRTTLQLKSGDCDDSTALVCTLLESVGIQTAIITSPGHVFMAFNTEIPVKNEWMYKMQGTVTLSKNGTLWIPIETTKLEKGFLEAWKLGSSEILRYSDKGQIEFLPVSETRERFPPLPLPEVIQTVQFPPVQHAAERFHTSFVTLKRHFLDSGISKLNKSADRLEGKSKAAVRNKIGALQAQFGHYREAKAIFYENLRTYPYLLSSYIFLANTFVLQKEYSSAQHIIEKGLKIKPDSAILTLLKARIHYIQNNFVKAKQYIEKLAGISKPLAEKYSYIAGGGSASSRAGTDDRTEGLIWSYE